MNGLRLVGLMNGVHAARLTLCAGLAAQPGQGSPLPYVTLDAHCPI